ncbi:hypothetical protein EDEG_02135 [Edhazardia aedis USNM 41457]|uniref:Uncharacterized protein n=1 Tax=Edhazardia aedis (strain USNM 41457) TaxID=1003232 RepID=J9D714_EDHAE|nr:hypothetical protein EDEG_02135 [Edhazardia aedis USNM 41457]|eukprot:EJW03551.1 hypothetical protein EDEG_02135 [Edhazardia aedis USNM 41457]
MSEEIHIGSAIRLLIENHQKHTTTQKKQLKSKYRPADINQFLKGIDTALNTFKLQLVGIDKKNNVSSYLESEKLTITKRIRKSDTEKIDENHYVTIFDNNSMECILNHLETKIKKWNSVEDEVNSYLNENFSKMIIVFAIIYLEGENIEITLLKEMLDECGIFFGEKEIDAMISDLKMKGYISIIKVEDITYVKFGWYFKAALPNFNLAKIFKIMDIHERSLTSKKTKQKR